MVTARALLNVSLAAALLVPLAPSLGFAQGPGRQREAAPAGPVRRLADGKPDLSGHYVSDGGGTNYGLEKHPQTGLTPGDRKSTRLNSSHVSESRMPSS